MAKRKPEMGDQPCTRHLIWSLGMASLMTLDVHALCKLGPLFERLSLCIHSPQPSLLAAIPCDACTLEAVPKGIQFSRSVPPRCTCTRPRGTGMTLD